MSAPKQKRRAKVQSVLVVNRATQRQWDKAANLIDELGNIVGDIPRMTLGHPGSPAQFRDALTDLHAVRDSLRAIRRWELKRFNQVPEAVREAMSGAIVAQS